MIPNEIGQPLHMRFALGETLTEEDSKTLAAWYAQQDAEESAQLSSSRQRQDEELASLRREIDNMLAEMVRTAEGIRSDSAENELLRERIRTLECELAAKKQVQPA